MPNRIRVSLKNTQSGDVITGPDVKRILAETIAMEAIWGKGLPEEWPKWKYLARLKYLKTQHIYPWELSVFIEPKSTPAIKSNFKLNIGGIKNKKRAPRLRVLDRWGDAVMDPAEPHPNGPQQVRPPAQPNQGEAVDIRPRRHVVPRFLAFDEEV